MTRHRSYKNLKPTPTAQAGELKYSKWDSVLPSIANLLVFLGLWNFCRSAFLWANRRTYSLALFCLVASTTVAATDTHQGIDPLFVSRGEYVDIGKAGGSPALVAGKDIVQITEGDGRLFLKGKKIGTTFFRLAGEKRTVHVLGVNDYATYDRLRQWRLQRRGPELKFFRGQVRLTGRILVLPDLEALETFSIEKMNYLNEMNVDSLGKKSVEQFLNQKLRDQGLDPGGWSFKPHWAHHLPDTMEKKAKHYRRVLKNFGVTVELGTNFSVQKKRTRIKVFIVQTTNNFHRKLGISPPTSVQGQVLVHQGRPQWDGETSFGASAIEDNGWGRILASPTLVVSNGESAHFHSGGEYPIPVSNTFVASVTWKKYGILLDAQPTWMRDGRVNLDIQTEISFLDHSQGGADGVPALVKSELKSNFQLKNKQILLISGLMRARSFSNRSGWPWLQQIPILSSLVSEKRKGRSELNVVFFVQVLEDAPSGTKGWNARGEDDTLAEGNP